MEKLPLLNDSKGYFQWGRFDANHNQFLLNTLCLSYGHPHGLTFGNLGKFFGRHTFGPFRPLGGMPIRG